MTDDDRTRIRGWEGRYLEDFRVGDVYRHAHGRTITQTDNTWFSLLTNNPHDVHSNVDYASRTEFGKPLVVSTLTLAIVTGLSVPDVSQNAVAWRSTIRAWRSVARSDITPPIIVAPLPSVWTERW